MGGCRCTFRQCSNNTVNSPGKHFFHFPYKDNERCKKWAMNADKLPFLSLPWTQLRNKTVCEDHFADSCFMNYKKERLIKTAVPMLYKVNGVQITCNCDAQELDGIEYSFNDKGAESKSIDLPDAGHVTVMDSMNAKDEKQSDTIIFETSTWNTADTVAVVGSVDTNVKNELRPIVLNRTCGRPVKRFAVRNIQNAKSPPKRHIIGEVAEPSGSGSTKQQKIEIEAGNPAVVINTKTYSKTNSNNSPIFSEVHSDLLDVPPSTENVITHSITANILEKINHIEERDANKVDKSLYLQMMAEQSKQIEDLKKLLTEKITEKREVQAENVASSTPSIEPRTIRVEKGPAMTKVQLFNGIRKYLNPTMVALLRMEMFGSSEREYRPDEKQFSKELYNLNRTVYDYMRDEWRFRLPPKSTVETWLKTPDDEETWELC